MIKPATYGYRYVANDPDRPARFPLLIVTDGSSIAIRRWQKNTTKADPSAKRWWRCGSSARRVSVRLAEMTYREWYYHPIDSIRYEREGRRIFCYARNEVIPLCDPTDLFEITLSMGDLIFERSREQKITDDLSVYIGYYCDIRHVQDVVLDSATNKGTFEVVLEE